jgi:hypothetical protein
MSWTPNPNEPVAFFEEPIVNNTLAIIERDFQGALNYYYPSDNFPDFRERALGQVLRNEFPCLAITPRTNPIVEADDRSHVVEAANLSIYIGVVADLPDPVTRMIMKYVRVMDAVLRTARQDFFTGMSNPFGVTLGITHDYGPIGTDESTYFRAAIVALTVNLRER